MTDLRHKQALGVVRRMLLTQYHRLAAFLNTAPAPNGMTQAAAKLAFEDVEAAIRALDVVIGGRGEADRRLAPGLERPATFYETVEEWLEKRGVTATPQEILELTEPYDELLRTALPAFDLPEAEARNAGA